MEGRPTSIKPPSKSTTSLKSSIKPPASKKTAASLKPSTPTIKKPAKVVTTSTVTIKKDPIVGEDDIQEIEDLSQIVVEKSVTTDIYLEPEVTTTTIVYSEQDKNNDELSTPITVQQNKTTTTTTTTTRKVITTTHVVATPITSKPKTTSATVATKTKQASIKEPAKVKPTTTTTTSTTVPAKPKQTAIKAPAVKSTKTTTSTLPAKPKQTVVKEPPKASVKTTTTTSTLPAKPKQTVVKEPPKPTQTPSKLKPSAKTTTTTTATTSPAKPKQTAVKAPPKSTNISTVAPVGKATTPKTTTTTAVKPKLSVDPLKPKTTSTSTTISTKPKTTTTPTTATTKTKTTSTLTQTKPTQTTTTTIAKPTAAKLKSTTTTTIPAKPKQTALKITPQTTAAKLPSKPKETSLKTPTKSTTATKTISKTTVSATPKVSNTKSILDELNNNNNNSPQQLKSINKPVGPTRRKPTVNPVKNLQSARSTTSQSPNTKSKTNMNSIVSGFGLLASVGAASASQEDMLSEWKNMKLHSKSSENEVRLIKCSGRKNIIPRMVELSNTVFRSNCCYILDTPNKIFEWRGSKSNKIQITKAMDLANRIKNKEKSGRPIVHVIEELKKSQFDDEFWSFIPNGRPGKEVSEEPEDKAKIKDILYKMVLSEKGDEISLIKPTLEGKGNKLYKELLTEDNGHTFVLDSWSEVYVWIGKQTNSQIKKVSMDITREVVMNRKGRPTWVTPMRVSEGTETELFKEKFFNWCSTLPIAMGQTPKGRVAQVTTQQEFKVSTMIDQWTLSPPLYLTKEIDDGKGQVQIWRVKDHAKEPIPKEWYGHFYEGESYVILYKYQHKNKDNYIIYFWQGKKSTINEKGSSALLTVDLDDSIGGVAQQIRVVQNKEPVHFFKIFNNFIVIHKGLMDDSIKSSKSNKLYHIKFCNIINNNISFRIIESNDLTIKNLNSNDYFIVKEKDIVQLEKPESAISEDGEEIVGQTQEQEIIGKEKIYLWKGKYSSNILNIDNEIQNIAKTMFKKEIDVVLIEEEKETNEFIELFEEEKDEIFQNGNVIDHNNNYVLEKIPKLYQCSISSGTFKVERIFEFDQDDLDQDDTMILDVGDFIFLWIGKTSTQDEKLQSMKTVLKYAEETSKLKENNNVESDGADLVTQINCYLVQSGLEPWVFRRYFHCWNNAKTQIHNIQCEEITLVKEYLDELNRTYTLEELKTPHKFLDKSRLEQYLSDQDFQDAFKMSREDFENLKEWKKQQTKKSLGLY